MVYESPHRIKKALESLNERAPERTITVARELTKLFEEIVPATAAEHLVRMESDPKKALGEFVLILSPGK